MTARGTLTVHCSGGDGIIRHFNQPPRWGPGRGRWVLVKGAVVGLERLA